MLSVICHTTFQVVTTPRRQQDVVYEDLLLGNSTIVGKLNGLS